MAAIQVLFPIFTDAEMQRLFTAIDSIRPSALQPHKHVVLPVMFRLIYTCGLRSGEARVLPANNVYLDSGEILITETKRSRDRMIVMSENMRTLCADYNEQRKVLSPDSPFFFPGTDGKAFASATISREFCKCWAKANPDVPKENLPAVRMYDLRHSFTSAAVQCWLDEGADLNAKLPFLRAYMGHASFSQTVLLHPENPNPLFFKGFLFAFQDFTPISPLLFASFRVSDQTLHSQHPAAVQGGCT